jgi:hypothetical protein
MSDKPGPYHSYLLRVWRSGEGRSARWLASLEDTRTGERRGFAGLTEAFAFLKGQTAAAEPPNERGRIRTDQKS